MQTLLTKKMDLSSPDIPMMHVCGPKVHVKFTIQHLYGDGKTSVTEESFYKMTNLEGKKLDDGKVIFIWKNTKDGWKMHRDMFSSNHPAK
jgi:NAD(P)H-flavin reductase